MMTDRELLQQALLWLDEGGTYTDKFQNFIDAIRTRLAQPEPEAVAWMYIKQDGMQVITDDPDYADGTWTPLYTAPPKKEWEGLTDYEVDQIEIAASSKVSAIYLAEAKLKEKNT